MINIFEDIVMTMFVAVDFIWLLKLWKEPKPFSKEKKTWAILFTAVFVLAFFILAVGHNFVGVVICLVGCVVSEFTVGITFYENFKNKEIAHE